MKIANHVLTEVPFVASPNVGHRGKLTKIRPVGAIVHGTGGWEGTVDWLTKTEARASYHVVIERDGTVTQMVPFNLRAWHAGKSSWGGKPSCNDRFIGIGLVCPGKLDSAGKSYFGKVFKGGQHVVTPTHGDGYWLPYTQAQIEALTAILIGLRQTYRIREIRGHWEVSPGRKIDPNPLCPLDTLRSTVIGAPIERAPNDKGMVEMAMNSRTVRGGGAGAAIATGVAAVGNPQAPPPPPSIEPITSAGKFAEEIHQPISAIQALSQTIMASPFRIAFVVLLATILYMAYRRIRDEKEGRHG